MRLKTFCPFFTGWKNDLIVRWKLFGTATLSRNDTQHNDTQLNDTQRNNKNTKLQANFCCALSLFYCYAFADMPNVILRPLDVRLEPDIMVSNETKQ